MTLDNLLSVHKKIRGSSFRLLVLVGWIPLSAAGHHWVDQPLSDLLRVSQDVVPVGMPAENP